MLSLNIGGVPEHFNLPWHLAMENNFFKKEGIQLNWTTCNGGTGQMTKMLEEGELDLAVLLTEGACKHIIENNAFRVVQFFIKTPLVWGIHVGADSAISSYSEAFNYPIAISRFGSGSHLMPQVDAHFKGKQIKQEQYQIIKNLNGALETYSSQPDMVFYWEKFTTKPYVDSGQLKRIGEFITPWPCFVIVASDPILKNHSKQIKKVLEIINYTSKQFMYSKEARELLVKRHEMLPKDAHQWFYMTEWETELKVNSKTLENVIQILKDCKVIENIIPTQSLIHEFN